tara:strand:+ start:865 stop:2238 length:1374 start_codon:yes stop_codon:yes gene_type:complete
MRYKDLITAINEEAINIKTFGERNPHYWANLANNIQKTGVLPVGTNGEEKVQILNPSNVANQMRQLWDGADLATPDQISAIRNFKIPTTDGKNIGINNIYKSPEIKGKSEDYNVGDIGEIALGVSSAAKFINSGQEIGIEQFLNLSNQLKVTPIKGKSALRADLTQTVTHPTGKKDNVNLVVVVPARSMKSFINFIKNFQSSPPDVRGTILSSIKYANTHKVLLQGIEKTRNDTNVNQIDIVSQGTQDQKGTKADLIMGIDGERINLISAKAGASQLGQASGKEWSKPQLFFQTVFGIDVNQYKPLWTEDHQENLKVLQKIYAEKVIPLVSKLVAGDNVQKETALVKQIVNGLIRYSNDINDKGESSIVDIVKLSTVPGSPGYKLMRIDSKLEAALENVNLIGEATPNKLGVQVSGVVDGRKLLLFRARSYYSPAGKLTRTIIEGGTLLDQLSVVTD